MTAHTPNSISHALSLISVAALIHVGSAAAASPSGDVQQQMSTLLAGRIATHSTQQSERPDHNTLPPAVEPQEFAKRLLLGVSGSPVGRPSESGGSNGQQAPLARTDTQATVRKLLLGARNAVAERS